MSLDASVAPPKLEAGDTIMLVSPSFPGANISPTRFHRAARWIERLGYKVRIGELTFSATTQSAEARAAEVNTGLSDPDVRALFAVFGGLAANGILRHIDYAVLRRDPKLVVGYSDVTAVLLALHEKSGVTTFHGPTVMPELGEWPEPFDYTATYLLHALATRGRQVSLVPAAATTDEYHDWRDDDEHSRELLPAAGWRVIRPGSTTGILWGGNLETICHLVGTNFIEPRSGRVLFLETTASSISSFEQCLVQLEDAGYIDGCAGMIVGRTFRAESYLASDIDALLSTRYAAETWPIVSHVDLGHSDPMLTIAVGSPCKLDAPLMGYGNAKLTMTL